MLLQILLLIINIIYLCKHLIIMTFIVSKIIILLSLYSSSRVLPIPVFRSATVNAANSQTGILHKTTEGAFAQNKQMPREVTAYTAWPFS